MPQGIISQAQASMDIKKETININKESSVPASRPQEAQEGFERKEKAEKQENAFSFEHEKIEKLKKSVLAGPSKKQVQLQAQDIKYLNDAGKIQKLLQIAKMHGVSHAIEVAKKLNDPYVLDRLHD